MTDEKLYQDFLAAFRASQKNVAMYSAQHPFFRNSLVELKYKADALLASVPEVRIGIAPKALMVESEYLKDKKLYQELAKDLHGRRIKALEIKQGVTLEEIAHFLITISRPPKEIESRGGLVALLEQQPLENLKAEALDYAQILSGQGEEQGKDVWIHLLGEASTGHSRQQMNELVENFREVIGKFKLRDFLSNKELFENVQNFFTFLQERQQGQYRKCVKDFIQSILQEKDVPSNVKLTRLTSLLRELSEHDLADLLWKEIVENEGFDATSFMLFSQLTDRNQHQAIASTLASQLSQKPAAAIPPQVRRKLREIFSPANESYISEIYRKTLSTLLEGLAFAAEKHIDREMVQSNYQLSLLNLLALEANSQRMAPMVERIVLAADGMPIHLSLEYLAKFERLLYRKAQQDPSLAKAMSYMDIRARGLLESAFLQGKLSSEFESFIKIWPQSALSAEKYLDIVFQGTEINRLALRLYLKFHTQSWEKFRERLTDHANPSQFLEKLIDTLMRIRLPAVYDALKQAFETAPDFLKARVLQVMSEIPMQDQDFLAAAVECGTSTAAKQAFLILSKEPESKNRFLEQLFPEPHIFGKNKAALLHAIELSEQADIRDAGPNLVRLSKLKSPWYWKIRKKAKSVLEKWHAPKS